MIIAMIMIQISNIRNILDVGRRVCKIREIVFKEVSKFSITYFKIIKIIH